MDEANAIRCIQNKRYKEVAGHLLERAIGAAIDKMPQREKGVRTNQISIAVKKKHANKIALGKGVSSSQELAEDVYEEMLEELKVPPDLQL